MVDDHSVAGAETGGELTQAHVTDPVFGKVGNRRVQ
jgi:hypothetical protein